MFMDNYGKLSLNHRQIPALSVSLRNEDVENETAEELKSLYNEDNKELKYTTQKLLRPLFQNCEICLRIKKFCFSYFIGATL